MTRLYSYVRHLSWYTKLCYCAIYTIVNPSLKSKHVVIQCHSNCWNHCAIQSTSFFGSDIRYTAKKQHQNVLHWVAGTVIWYGDKTRPYISDLVYVEVTLQYSHLATIGHTWWNILLHCPFWTIDPGILHMAPSSSFLANWPSFFHSLTSSELSFTLPLVALP